MKILSMKELDIPVTCYKGELMECTVKNSTVLKQEFQRDQPFTHVAIIEFSTDEVEGMEYGMGGAFYLRAK